MDLQKQSDYTLIEIAIEYFKANVNQSIHLDELAAKMNLSKIQVNALFKNWAEINPIQFFQNILLKKDKKIQIGNEGDLFEDNLKTTNSRTNKPPKSFTHIEEMESENKEDNLMCIEFNFYESPFGNLLLANTEKGICYAAFVEQETKAISSLKSFFPNAKFQKQTSWIQENALLLFQDDQRKIKPIILHLKGSPFQLEVWQELIKIPMGQLSTYGAIAKNIGRPKAARAVGTAIGQNPIAFLNPCHRIVQASGKIGGYMWGNTRKIAIIGWELAKKDHIIYKQEMITT